MRGKVALAARLKLKPTRGRRKAQGIEIGAHIRERPRMVILVGLGANLPSSSHGEPRATLGAALDRLVAAGVVIVRRSRWYRSAPVPAGDQPWFANAVAVVSTGAPPDELLATLHAVERALGRRRRTRNEPRVVDLDLLAYDDLVQDPGPGETMLALPHPRLHERAFVLLPLREVAPDWRHPVSGHSVRMLIDNVAPGQTVTPMPEDQPH
jgi:2-amino-4-hydroxy-6-hydroxymethyldihydropteridine diphosphokinase